MTGKDDHGSRRRLSYMSGDSVRAVGVMGGRFDLQHESGGLAEVVQPGELVRVLERNNPLTPVLHVSVYNAKQRASARSVF